MLKWPIGAKETEKLQLELTSYCNLACPGCERLANPAALPFLNTNYMHLEDIKKWFTIETLPKLAIISFSGQIDEPIIHPEADKIIEYLIEEFPSTRISISTNGATRNEKFFTRIGEISNKYKRPNGDKRLDVEFAIDGLEDTNHIYRVGADWNKIMRNAKAFIAAGGLASWKFIMFNHNYNQVKEANKMAVEMGFHRFTYIASARKSTEKLGMNFVPKLIKGKKPINSKAFGSVKSPPGQPKKTLNDGSKPKIHCKALKRLDGRKGWLFVNHDGFAQPCCYFGFQHRTIDPLDNLHNISAEEFFDTSPFLTGLMESWESDKPNPICARKCTGAGNRDSAITLLRNGEEQWEVVKNR